jgi:hypothetical protein
MSSPTPRSTCLRRMSPLQVPVVHIAGSSDACAGLVADGHMAPGT